MFGDDFLAKRFAAGKEEGLEEGREEGLEEGVVKGREELRAELRAELRKFLAENPETAAEQFKDRLLNGDLPDNGKNPEQGRTD